MTWLWQKTVDSSGVETGREQHRREVESRLVQLPRLVLDRDRVQVDDAEEGVVRLLRLDVLAEAAAVVAERLAPGRLDPGENPGLRGFGCRSGVGVTGHGA